MDIQNKAEQVKLALEADEVHLQSQGSHFQVLVISDALAALSRIKQQQTVYAHFADEIADGSMHALTIRVFSQDKWDAQRHQYLT